MAALLIPQVVERRLLDLFGSLAILRGLFLFAKEVREIGGGIQASVDRSNRVGEDAAPLLPEIV